MNYAEFSGQIYEYDNEPFSNVNFLSFYECNMMYADISEKSRTLLPNN